MDIGDFKRDLERGKPAEQFAASYFKKYYANCTDVSENQAYFKIDTDFIVNADKWEVKQNLVIAEKGKPGEFFRIELYRDDKPKGWWWYCKANKYFFVNAELTKAIIINNDDAFKNFINNAIENESHGYYDDFRYDRKKDNYYGKITIVKSMRIYTEFLEDAGVNFQRVVTRRK